MIYQSGVFCGNYPELVKVLEHAKDHVKAELKSSKERLEFYYPSTDDSTKDVINKMYMDKGI